MHLIATVQHHVSAVYIINALHALLYPTMTSSWLQGLPFHSPVYNTLWHVCRYVARSIIYYIYMMKNTNRMQQGVSEASPPACNILFNYYRLICIK